MSVLCDDVIIIKQKVMLCLYKEIVGNHEHIIIP